jgi:hypothetical protein
VGRVERRQGVVVERLAPLDVELAVLGHHLKAGCAFQFVVAQVGARAALSLAPERAISKIGKALESRIGPGSDVPCLYRIARHTSRRHPAREKGAGPNSNTSGLRVLRRKMAHNAYLSGR